MDGAERELLDPPTPHGISLHLRRRHGYSIEDSLSLTNGGLLAEHDKIHRLLSERVNHLHANPGERVQ